MSAEMIGAIFAGVTLLILWTVTVLGGGVWLMNQLKTVKGEILADFDAKHQANQQRYDALNTLVTRHDTILNPEWRSAFETRKHQ